jgi:hypothetical protein
MPGEFPAEVPESEPPEDVIDIEVAENVFLGELLTEGVCAELIVLLTLLRITQNGVGLADLLEFFLGTLFVGGVAVWVMLESKLSVGFLDVVEAGALVDTECFVIVDGHDFLPNPSGVNLNSSQHGAGNPETHDFL